MEQQQSSTPLVTSFQVAAVYASDLDRSRRFYVDLLGLEERGEMSPGVLLGVGTFALYLEGGRTPAAEPGTKLTTTSLCFDSASIHAAYDRLRSAGVPVVEEYRELTPEFAMFRVADPDGNVVEFAGQP